MLWQSIRWAHDCELEFPRSSAQSLCTLIVSRLHAGFASGAGAACAGLLAQSMHLADLHNADVYTVLFGAPRAGTSRYVDALQAQVCAR